MRESVQVCMSRCLLLASSWGGLEHYEGACGGCMDLLSAQHWQEGHRSLWYLMLPLALPHSCSCNLTWEDQGRLRVRTKRKYGPEEGVQLGRNYCF